MEQALLCFSEPPVKPVNVPPSHYSEVDRLTVSTAARVLSSDCIQCCDHRTVSNRTAVKCQGECWQRTSIPAGCQAPISAPSHSPGLLTDHH